MRVDAGANTSDILTQYISTIKALHELDPSGTTLGAISLPVQLYLRGRQVTWYKSTNSEAAAGTNAAIVTQGGVAGHSEVHSYRADGRHGKRSFSRATQGLNAWRRRESLALVSRYLFIFLSFA